MDFTYLNHTCSIDPYPLPNIDKIYGLQFKAPTSHRLYLHNLICIGPREKNSPWNHWYTLSLCFPPIYKTLSWFHIKSPENKAIIIPKINYIITTLKMKFDGFPKSFHSVNQITSPESDSLEQAYPWSYKANILVNSPTTIILPLGLIFEGLWVVIYLA